MFISPMESLLANPVLECLKQVDDKYLPHDNKVSKPVKRMQKIKPQETNFLSHQQIHKVNCLLLAVWLSG